jgi:hypothetical protein
MAAREDAKSLQEQAYDLAGEGKLVELTSLLEEHPEVDLDEYRDKFGGTALTIALRRRNPDCAQLLIEHGADVNTKNKQGWSTLHNAADGGLLGCVELLVRAGLDVNSQNNNGRSVLMYSTSHLRVAQYLLEQKADIHYRVTTQSFSTGDDAVQVAMESGEYNPGVAFAFLACNTDANNVRIDPLLTFLKAPVRDYHIETYSHVQAYIDEYHRILNLVLSEHVPVDTRFGLGQMGIYQEPLERTLEYLGLSMSKDQVVNTSIDGEAVRRALIPGHLLNAKHWFDKHSCDQCPELEEEEYADSEEKTSSSLDE